MDSLLNLIAITEEEPEPTKDSIFDYEEIFGATEEPELEEQPSEETLEDISDEAGDSPTEEIESLILDGEEVSIDELLEWKKGQLRMSDYTKKTQEVKDEKLRLQQLEVQNQEANNVYDFLRTNPDLLKILNDYASETDITIPQINTQTPQQQQSQPNHDPRVDEILKQNFFEKTEASLNRIISEGTGVTDIELLQLADELKTDVETAYEVWKGKNIDKIVSKKLQEEKFRINEELKQNKQSTVSLINGTQSKPKGAANLSEIEQVMAQRLDMSFEEFAKWKNYNPNN